MVRSNGVWFIRWFDLMFTFEIKFSIAVLAWSIILWPRMVFWFIDAEVSRTKHSRGIVRAYGTPGHGSN